MNTQGTATIGINEEKKELRSILKESPLYLDMSLLEREDFMRYLVSVVLR